ncbi:TIGR03905 family TSCPD domain-containing protein [Sporanaerobacter sp. PP17-6a]|jgi:uncharacterized protein (TIGR03905 family)|uniref:TIGR03905 family TSCPD domain-containing protein n=1 Tax=Sporanaerobacter sp. PP17-6a TaxID=1891289 RepID=UPI00089FF4DD|nr:TIGR03905 family TSCPD domain-containing protein [Sporanaerobacter sp. PP17-6a]MBE6082369.1 TIGR03905 family TSCPD domain-containing protein [Tissierellaceae bacterium]SCL92774.1 TSCPD domain protein [Sporanaerobacter sp. PP17-6a]
MYEFIPRGVCSRRIFFNIEDGKIKDLNFVGGCNGNLQGISRLVEGMTPEEVIKKFSGIKCGGKKTSCPDQLSRALTEYLKTRDEKAASN